MPNVGMILSQSGDQPVKLSGDRRYRKDAIRLGKFYANHPFEAGKKVELDVTPDRMSRWLASFRDMQRNGVKVNLTVDHKNPRSAEAKRGEVVEMSIEDDRLWFETAVADDDSERLIQRCGEVSVEIDANAKDGEGREYGEAITAISVCQNPVVPDQQPFVRVAASRDAGTAEHVAVWFSANSPSQSDPDPNPDPNDGSPAMPLTFTDDQAKKIRDTLNLSANAKPEDVLAGLVTLSTETATPNTGQAATREIKRLRDAGMTDAQIADKIGRDEATVGKIGRGEIENPGDDLVEALGQVTVEAVKASLNPSGPANVKLSRDVQGVLEEALDAKIDTLRDQGRFTPAVADKLRKRFKGGGALMLSREAVNADKSIAMGILDDLAENDPAKLLELQGERTGHQVTLSRSVPGGETSDSDEELEALEKRTREYAGEKK